MLAQLLGMGRKKDPPKDKDSSGGEKEQRRDDALADGGSSLGDTASSQSEAACAGQAMAATALSQAAPPSIPSAPAPLRPAPNGAGNTTHAVAAQATATTGRGYHAQTNDGGGRGNLMSGNGTMPGDAGSGAATGMAQDGGAGVTTVAAAAAGPGPAAFASPALITAVVQQPLGHKAFSSEAAAVERGLHLQLGDKDAKTESQLGGQQLEAAKRLRHLLVTNRERMVQELLNRGWVPLLLRWLGLAHRPSLQVEALSALTTVAQSTTEHTPLLLKHGAVGTLVSLLKSPSLEMVEQSMWVLGKMAQDSQDGTTTARDAVLQAGVLGPLVRCLEEHPSLLSLQRIGAWSLFNLLDGQPRPTVDVPTVNTVMPAINRLLMAGDSEVLSHACSALSHLCDGSAAHIKIVVESGVCRRLVQLLDHPSSQVVKPALRTIGNVVCAEDDADYTEAILEAGSVVCLKKLIAHPNREIQKEACWTLSNIAAGSVSQIQSVLDSGAMPQLIKLATSADTESEVRSEAFWVVLNAASCGSDAQIEYLVSQGCVQILSDLLGESSMVMMALEGIERVLSVGDLRVVRNAIASHSHHDGQGPGGAGSAGGSHGGDDEHCEECASVEAVGTAAAAAAAAAARGGEGLGLGADDAAGAYTNPYACMLTPEKIQALEAHKNSAVAKRANRVWARYFVTCAICRGSFSRHGSSATFCAECNCHVCGTCDCTVFHLAYQDKLWEEMEGKEKRGKKAQQAAKKNKKAKKREKKRNAAKELAAEPPPKDAGTGGGDGNGGREGGGAKRSNGKKNKSDGAGDENADARTSVQPPQDLGKQTHHRSDSPHKASSSASTESNSEDEYDPSSSPQAAAVAGTKYDAASAAPATSVAAAIINATAISVTAPAASAAKKSGATRTTTATPPKKSTAHRPPAVVTPTAAPDDSRTASGQRAPSQPEDARGQRRAGKKQGRRDQPQPQPQPRPAPGQLQHGKSLFSALSTSSSASSASAASSSSSSSTITAMAAGRGAPAAAAAAAVASRVPDDESEQPWVVVGGTGGKRAGTAKGIKGQQQKPANPVPVGAGGGGGGSASSVVWASESSPASVAVRAVTPVRPSVVVSPSPAAAVPRVPPPPFAVPAVVPPSAGGGGSAWGGGAAALKPAAAPALSNGLLRPATNATNSPHVAPQRPGPAPGSVWGTSAAMVDARAKPFLVAAAGGGAGAPPPQAVSPSGAPFAGMAASRPAPGPANQAGVIGPRPAVAVAVASSTATTTMAKPVGLSGPLVPAAKALPPAAGGGGRVATAVMGGGKSKAGPGVVGRRLAAGGTAAAPSLQAAAVSGANGGGLVRTASSGSEALVENEKLVSFLLETGSILALAQRLEEEEDWRRPTPSS